MPNQREVESCRFCLLAIVCHLCEPEFVPLGFHLLPSLDSKSTRRNVLIVVVEGSAHEYLGEWQAQLVASGIRKPHALLAFFVFDR